MSLFLVDSLVDRLIPTLIKLSMHHLHLHLEHACIAIDRLTLFLSSLLSHSFPLYTALCSLLVKFAAIGKRWI